MRYKLLNTSVEVAESGLTTLGAETFASRNFRESAKREFFAS